MAMKKHWIQKATQKNKGVFSKKAHRAGMSTGAYAAKEAHASGRLGKQARAAQTLIRLSRGR